MWAEGVSAGGISRTLGDVSRSAVLGKLQRLGLLKSRKAASAPRAFGDETGDSRVASAFPLRRPPRRDPPPSPWRTEAFRPLPETSPRPWLTRTAEECAFPVDGAAEPRACCAQRRRGSPYCAAHHSIVYRPAPSAP
jgi:GcrA cell cycle regulator